MVMWVVGVWAGCGLLVALGLLVGALTERLGRGRRMQAMIDWTAAASRPEAADYTARAA
ncbi:hypothetical protein [Nakamurella endophytica]|uniref:Uncharacterized protein n=1 Tax=Nakamurella endophytica TaxID=1748367 RepID=A0A917WFM3_9ACTN|nr:hypothetical protein [Nakamurella endophytica]GGL99305.1 hypothetical protein GCM10011594_19110 [Nakamurella endophytica]